MQNLSASSVFAPMNNGRYIPSGILGNGTYGQVVRCFDARTGGCVAVKVAHREAAYRRSALNEARVLQLLAGMPTVVTIIDSFEDSQGRVCIATELLHKNLYEILKQRNFEPLPLHAVRAIGLNILRCLAALHAAGYMHCDVKPENVMIRDPRDEQTFASTCLIDFGAVRQLRENAYYDVQSLWYRAPEVLCGLPYSPQIDAWSVGCLLYELHAGAPLFPGDSPQDQLAHIIAAVGLPSQEAMTLGRNAPGLHFYAAPTAAATATSGRALTPSNAGASGLGAIFEECTISDDAGARAGFVSLLRGLLDPNERRRLSCTDALSHPFVTGACFHRPPAPLPLLAANNAAAAAATGGNNNAAASPTPSMQSFAAVGSPIVPAQQQQQQHYHHHHHPSAPLMFVAVPSSSSSQQQQLPHFVHSQQQQQQQPMAAMPFLGSPFATVSPVPPMAAVQQQQQQPAPQTASSAACRTTTAAPAATTTSLLLRRPASSRRSQ